MHTHLRRLGALTASTALLAMASAGVFAPAASAQGAPEPYEHAWWPIEPWLTATPAPFTCG